MARIHAAEVRADDDEGGRAAQGFQPILDGCRPLKIWHHEARLLVSISADAHQGNYLHYGVREFAMSAIGNGVALHGGFIPYTGTFLVFSEYARNAVRMAALMGVRQIFVYPHHSIGLGEDGPTHQAVEQGATLRLLPNLAVWRPCDAVETTVAWKAAAERADGPSALLLTRQNVPNQARSADQLALVERGGYVLRDCEGEPAVILIATGSEVELAAAAHDALTADGVAVRLVSMPCVEVFEIPATVTPAPVMAAAAQK